jgi:2-aminoadipate transaminase
MPAGIGLSCRRCAPIAFRGDPMTSYDLSRAAGEIKTSDVRDLLRYAQRPDMISLAGGLPDLNLMDLDGLRAAAASALATSWQACLQYGVTEGQPALKEALIEHLAPKGINAAPESIVVTSGSQQALDLIARTLLDRGDTVVVERPTYFAALQALGLCGPRFATISIDGDGGRVDELESMKFERKPRLVYVVSNFANPSGVSMSLERRDRLARWAVRNEVFVLEDDPYGDLQTSGSSIPTVAALSKNIPGAAEWCGYTSTLSKCVAPGLRIGWLVLPRELARRVALMKQAADLQTSPLSQEIAASYLRSGRLPGRLAVIRREYGCRRKVLQESLRSSFGPRLTFDEGNGGMFLWARFADGTQTRELLDYALEQNVMFVPGDAFFAERPDTATLRLNFTAAAPERIRLGVDRLHRAHANYWAAREGRPPESGQERLVDAASRDPVY